MWLYHEQLAEHRPPVEGFIAGVVLSEVMRASPEVRHVCAFRSAIAAQEGGTFTL